MYYSIKRNTIEIANVRPEGQQEKEIMSKDITVMSFSSPDPIHFQVGDYVDVWGERYELFELAEPTKDSENNNKYRLNFKAQYYKLKKWKFRFYDRNNELKMVQWELLGTLQDFLNLIVANANRNLAGWTAGECDESEPLLLPFNGENILQALSQIAEAFKTEWRVVNKVIHFKKNKGVVTGYKFEYGYDKGLKGGLTRTNVDSSGAFSRLFVQGSEQNLPPDYMFGQKRLQLPDGMEFIQGTKYGPDEIEFDIIFDDIRPERIGSISAVGDIFNFTDDDIDFNVNDQLLPGLDPKISFLTGDLAGQNFNIAKGGFNSLTKTFTIVKSELEKSILPNDDIKPKVGDTYYIFDIKMPDSYVIDASQRLLARALEYKVENAAPKVAYSVPPDHFFFAKNSIVLNLGDYYGIKDFTLLVNKDIRMIGYVRDLHEEFKYLSMSISDDAPIPTIVQEVNETKKVKKSLDLNKIMDIRRARENWKTTNQLSTLLDTVRAEMLLITVDGGAYTTNITSETTLTDFISTAGQVFHAQYLDHNGIWEVTGLTTSLTDDIPYYLYVRASRAANSAQMIISPTKIAVESDPLLYYFPYGVISSIIDGNRSFQSLIGYTKAIADTLETGRIVSHNGLTYWDLNGDLFKIGPDGKGWDWGVTTPNEMTIHSAIASKVIKVGSDGLVNAGISGVTDAAESSIRLWAGETEENKYTAPFRVLDNGEMVAESGKLSNFNIIGNGLTNDDGEAFVSVKKIDGSNSIGASVGSGIDAASFWGLSAKAAGVFVNTIPGPDDNVGVYIDVANSGVGTGRALALNVNSGAVLLSKNAPLILEKSDGTLEQAIDEISFRVILDTGGSLTLSFVNGNLTRAV